MHDADRILRDILAMQRDMLGELKSIRDLLASRAASRDDTLAGGPLLRAMIPIRQRPSVSRQFVGMDMAGRKR